ncbi:hypothetical protein TSH100_08795 [Azospirillum sp. TSH100]|nr:hypothetical protein TSH100_08795 [Azospirillum sp. TSH100]
MAQAMAGTPVLAAWLHRSRAEAAASIADAQGRRVDPNRLRTLLARVPARASRDWGATMLALDLMRQMLADDADDGGAAGDAPPLVPTGADDAMARMEAALEPTKGAVLIACGLGFLAHLEAGGDRGGACLAVSRFLAVRGMTPLPVPCLNGVEAIRRADPSGTRPGGGWPSGNWPSGNWLVTFLDGMARQAEEGEESLIALLHRWRGWRRRVGDRRSDARIRRAVDAVAAEGVMSPARLAARLRCATSAATDLLEELQRLEIAVEITRRRTHRVFVAEDLASMLGEVAPRSAAAETVGAIPAAPLAMLPEPDRWVEPAEGVDDALANLERILKRQDPLLARYGRTGG